MERPKTRKRKVKIKKEKSGNTLEWFVMDWMKTRVAVRWKIIFFFHSGTIRKHNIIYKLTYTIVVGNNLQKPLWAFYFCLFFLFLFLSSNLLFVVIQNVNRMSRNRKNHRGKDRSRRSLSFTSFAQNVQKRKWRGRAEKKLEYELINATDVCNWNRALFFTLKRTRIGQDFSMKRETREEG